MALPVHIVGGPDDTIANVNRLGQFVTAPLAYDEVVFKELAEPNVAYNFYKSQSGQRFVITGIRAKADRQVSTTVDADVVIYEASAEDTTTVDKVLHQEAMVRGEDATLLPMNVLVRAGKYVNAKTTDDDIHMTIMGYYVPEVS
jgi:hypothetical protein